MSSTGYSQVEILDAQNSVSDLSAKRWHAAVLTSTGLDIAGANTATFYGNITRGDKAGRPTTVARYGSITKCMAGAAITEGALLTTDAQGRYVTATTGQHVVGRALESPSAANSLFAAELVALGTAP